ncbi:MAG: hypothetical protein LDL24_03315 [Treponema sp.]|nr:hypothetical protein [Treponema sp.]
MGIRISPLGLGVFLFSLALFNSLTGLAGPLSRLLVLFPFFVVGSSLLQVWYSYMQFGFHQEFSSDHPVRGESIRYHFVIHQEGLLPSCLILCRFSFKGPGLAGINERSVFLGSRESQSWSFSFRCAYRGVYAVGLEHILFKDSLGLFELSYRVEPRMFYVYPELIPLSHSLEYLFTGSGETGTNPGGLQDDVGVFDSVYPLRHGEGGRQIAWKRFAATGIPSALKTARASAQSLRIVLDLRPAPFNKTEEARLLAEDLALSLVFSVLRYMAERGISAELFAGCETGPYLISEMKSFEWLYSRSTNILFTETSLPQAAWEGDKTTLLVSLLPPLSQAGSQEKDFYSIIEQRLRGGYRILFISVPGPEFVLDAQNDALHMAELLPFSPWIPCRVLDTRQGSEGIAHVFE